MFQESRRFSHTKVNYNDKKRAIDEKYNFFNQASLQLM